MHHLPEEPKENKCGYCDEPCDGEYCDATCFDNSNEE